MTKNEYKEKFNVNVDNIVDGRFYEGNIIIQCFANYDESEDDLDDKYQLNPLYFLPRKERCSDYGEIDLKNEDDKKEYLENLKDSAERLKILAALMEKHAKEIEEFGYPKTSFYYPDLEELDKI